MDKLELLFELQQKFDQKVIEERHLDFDQDTWVQKEILAIMSELAEILAETNFKWWKNPQEIKQEALTEEVIDLLHFFISLCLKIGLTPDELVAAYLKKNKENHLRQEGLSGKLGYNANDLPD